MERMLLVAGRAGTLIGVLLTAIAVLGRLGGYYWMGGFQTSTLLLAGIAATVTACACFLWVLTARPSGKR